MDRLKNIISNHKINERLFDDKIHINFILQIYNLLVNLNKYNNTPLNIYNKVHYIISHYIFSFYSLSL